MAPWVVGLALLLAVAAGAAWYFEGRFETTPAEAAKRLLPYKAEEVQKVVRPRPRGASPSTATPAGSSPPGARLPPPRRCRTPRRPRRRWVLPPSTKLEGTLGQLNQLTIDHVLLEEPSRSPEFGLDAPR